MERGGEKEKGLILLHTGEFVKKRRVCKTGKRGGKRGPKQVSGS